MANSSSRTQLRGHCQVCGREQAVDPSRSGLIHHHGYNLRFGYFQGTCTGHHSLPMEKDRTHTDSVIGAIRTNVARLRRRAAKLRAGTEILQTIRRSRYNRDARRSELVEIVFASLPAFEQARELEMEIADIEFRARSGEDFAIFLAALVEAKFGKPLRSVAVEKREPLVHFRSRHGIACRSGRGIFSQARSWNATRVEEEVTCERCRKAIVAMATWKRMKEEGE